jgi:hypothetical protein
MANGQSWEEKIGKLIDRICFDYEINRMCWGVNPSTNQFHPDPFGTA